MSYTKNSVFNFLEMLSKVNNIKVLPYQKLDSVVLKNTLEAFPGKKIIYLLESNEDEYHALIMTGAECHYIYVNHALINSNQLLAFLEATDLKVKLFITPLNLPPNNEAIGFTEAVYQLLIKGQIEVLDLRAAYANQQKIYKEIIALQKTKVLLLALQKKLKENLPVIYYGSPIGIYGELISGLPILVRELFSINIDKKLIKNYTASDLLKIIGWITGTYFLTTSSLYYSFKPIGTYYAGHGLVTFTKSYIPQSMDISDGILFISNLLLLIEACCANDTRQPIYALFAVATHIFLAQFAKWILPLFKEEQSATVNYQRITLLMLISMFSRIMSNVFVGYGYETLDNQARCQAASQQFVRNTQSQTAAVATSCNSAWIPNFWQPAKKLYVIATTSKSKTYEIECDLTTTECISTREYEQPLI